MGGKGSGLAEGFWSVVHWQAPLVKNHYKNGTYYKYNWIEKHLIELYRQVNSEKKNYFTDKSIQKKKLLSPWHQSAYTGLAD